MPNSPILAIPQVAENQDNTYITVNNAVAALEAATNAHIAYGSVGAGPVNITEGDAVAYVLYRFSGASADFDVVFPDMIGGDSTQRLVVFVNDDATYVATVSAGGVEEITVGPNTAAICYLYEDTISLLGNANTGTPTFPYDFGAFIPGQPGDGAVVATFLISRANVTCADDFVGSYGHVAVNPTGSAVFSISRNGSAVGSITVSPLGAFTFATTGGALALSAGDRVTVTAPSPPDATLSGVSFVFAATRTE